MTTARCLRCKEQREMVDEKEVTLKNLRKALKGKCEICQCKMFKFLPKDNGE